MRRSVLFQVTKEQWSFAGACVVAALVLLLGTGGAGEEGGEVPPGVPRASSFPVVEDRAPVKADVRAYEAGRNIFEPPGKARLSLPSLPLPKPSVEAPALPPFEPGPGLSGLVAEGKWKFLYLEKGKPPIPAEALDLSGWDAIAGLQLPEVKDPPDLREKMFPGRELTRVFLKDGTVYRGEVSKDRTGKIVIVITPDGKHVPIHTDKIDRIEPAMTYEDVYRERRQQRDRPRKLVELAQDLLRWGMIPEAKKELDFVCRRNPGMLEVLDQLLDLHLRDAEFEEALELLQYLLERGEGEDRRTQIHLRLGRIWEKLGLFRRAARFYDFAFPALLEAGVAKGRVLYRAGDDQGAVRAVEAVLRMPDVPEKPAAEARTILGLARLRSGFSAETRGRIEEDFEAALRVNPEDAGALTGRAVLRATRGDFGGASRDLIAAVRSDPYYSPAWVSLAILLSGAGKNQEARVCIEKGLEHDPTAATLHSLSGLLDLLEGKRAEAQAAFERARTVRKGDAYATYGLALVHHQAGDLERARSLYLEALGREFYFTPVYYGAAIAELQVGGGGDGRLRAEALLREVLRLRPKYRNGIVALTLLYLQEERYEEAQRVFEGVEDRIAGDPLLLYLNGYLTYYGDEPDDERRVEEARDRFAEAAKTPPGYPDAGPVVRELNEWLATYVVLEEKFNREPGPTVGAGWNENDIQDAFPIEIAANPGDPAGKDGRCRFRSLPAGGGNRNLVYFSLEREVPGTDLRSIEATFYPKLVKGVDSFGMCMVPLGKADGGRAMVTLFRYDSREERVVTGFMRSLNEQALQREKRLVVPWMRNVRLEPDEIRVRYLIEREETGVKILLQVFEPGGRVWKTLQEVRGARAPEGSFKLVFFVRTRMNAEYEFEIDNVRVLERRLPE